MNEIDLLEELDDKTKLLFQKMQKELKSKEILKYRPAELYIKEYVTYTRKRSPRAIYSSR